LSVSELIGGRRIIQHEITDLGQGFPLPNLQWGTDLTWTSIPDSYKTKIRFRSGSMDYTIPTADLNGRKIALTFDFPEIQLRLDDGSPEATAIAGGNTFDFKITITHPGNLNRPGSAPPLEDDKTYKINDSFAYAIVYGFSPSGRLLQKRFEQLNTYLDSQEADDTFKVRSELLNIMGLTWLYQSELTKRLLASQNDVLTLTHHRFGRMSQEEGFYIDVGLSLSANTPADGDRGNGRYDNLFHLGSLYASAFEHGIIEQMQPGASAISTVNIIRQANKDGNRIYLANASNWPTVRSQLQNGSYPPTTLTDAFDKYFNPTHSEYAPETKLFLPRNYSITPKLSDNTDGNWTGSGWVIRNRSQAGMIISGGYSGGYSYWPPNSGNHYVSSPPISTSSFSNPSYTYSSPSMPSLKPLPGLPTLPKMYGSDPVDMASGAFIYANVDLETGTEGAPLGLNFSRHYSSISHNRDSQNLGYGWSHPMHIRANVRTATEEALGLGTIQHAAALLTSTLVGSDLYRDDASPKEWTVTALAVGWFVDQMTNNAVSITIGPDTFQFIKQPNGTYSPPAGSTMELTEVDGNYRLKQRLGNALQFEPNETADDNGQRIHKIINPDGKEMVFHYHADDRLDYVEDAFGRSYTFGYNADNRIEQITDSTGRDVHYRYDSHGNLDRFTDPEGKHFYWIYEAATDPDGATPADPTLTTAEEHRIVRMRNHDKEIVTQNVWDPLGRVKAQYLHGDTDWTWEMAYTGRINYEKDPAGGVTAYLYDERGRSAGKIDAEGYQMTRRYDGQDRVVERISGTDEITSYKYDTAHNLTRIDYSGGGGSTINEYDALHRLRKTTDPENNVTELVYFTSGFNAGKNRPQFLIDPVGTTTFAYFESGPAAGRVQTMTDDDGLVIENKYDAYAQPEWTEAPGGLRTTFTYTPRGDLDLLEDPNGTQTDFTYNDRRQVTQIISDFGGADAATENRFYDNQGRLERILAAPHDGGQRVEERFTYNPTDLPKAEFLTNETASLADDLIRELHYDGRDLVDRVTDAVGRETHLRYFDNREIEEIERPAARLASYQYDADNRLVTQTKPGTPTTRNYGYAYAETATSEGDQTEGYPRSIFTDADNLTTTTEFNRLGQPRFYRNKSDHIFEFRYDGLGRRTHSITPLDAANSRATLTVYNHRGEV
ncbi:MAG: RHS repeat protein, partial [Puniceicoccaceae bacterium]